MIERTQAQSMPEQPQGKPMTTKPPRLPDPCTPEQAAEWLTHRSDETWTGAAVLSQMFAVEAQSNETRIAYERGIVLVRIRPGTKLLRLINGEWMPFETVAAMHLEAETGTALAYVFKGGEHYDATGGVIHLDPVDDSFIGQLASLGHATPRLLVDRDGTRYHVTEPVQASDIRLRKDWVKELLPGTVFLREFDPLAMGIERGEHPDIASMLDSVQNTDAPTAAKKWRAAQEKESDGSKQGEENTSKPAERRAYFRKLWIKHNQPETSHLWNLLKNEIGNGSPILDVTAHINFMFLYSDGTQKRHVKHTFETDMSEAKKAPD